MTGSMTPPPRAASESGPPEPRARPEYLEDDGRPTRIRRPGGMARASHYGARAGEQQHPGGGPTAGRVGCGALGARADLTASSGYHWRDPGGIRMDGRRAFVAVCGVVLGLCLVASSLAAQEPEPQPGEVVLANGPDLTLTRVIAPASGALFVVGQDAGQMLRLQRSDDGGAIWRSVSLPPAAS